MNVMTLSTVTLNERLLKLGVPKDEYRTYRMLNEFISALVKDRPSWRFVATNIYNRDETSAFEIYQDGELIGIVSRGYYNGNSCLEICNHRIEAGRQRSGGYRTKDVTKAVAKAKKLFSRKSAGERMNEAMKKVNSIIDDVRRGKEYELRRNAHNVELAMLEYVKGEGLAAFNAFLQAYPSIHHNTLKAQENVLALEQELVTVNAFTNPLQNTVTIVRVDDHYILNNKNVFTMRTDHTLSEEMRGKLGMLKLVNAQQIVEGVGCRVDDDTFVLLVEGEVK
jgi:hypothetical protein